MKLPLLKEASERRNWYRIKNVAWWIERCSGTPEEMRVVAYTLLLEWVPYRHVGFDQRLKEIPHEMVHASRLVRPGACQSCGAVGHRQAHHVNYRRPLDVYWLCPSCHGGIHSSGLSWESSEEDLRPLADRAPGTFSLETFPLLDALWRIREELIPLGLRYQGWLASEIASDLTGGPNPEPKPEEPAIAVLGEAARRGELARSILHLVRDPASRLRLAT